MSGRGPRGIKASRWDAAETSRGRERRAPEHPLIRKSPPGLIFMCNSKTKRDCYIYRVLGLPPAKRDLVEHVVPGMFLFLFDIDVRELHGIFEASSHGGLNLEPNAFKGQGSYPAQVSKLMQLFRPVEAPRKRLLVDPAAAALHDAGGRKLDLLGRTPPITGGVELTDRISQYRLPASGIRLEERLPRRDLLLRPDAHPLMTDGVGRQPVPQTRVLDGLPERKDLLTRGPLEEVDQLALKYLQPGDPGAGRALNPRHQSTAFEAPRVGVSSLQQEAILRGQVLEVERLKRAAIEQARLREQASGLVASPFAAAHARAVAIPEFLRPTVDVRRRR